MGFWSSIDVQQNNANDMAIDSKDNIYVADTYGYHIQKFDTNGNLIKKWAVNDTHLRGIAIDSEGRLKVYLLGTVGGIGIDHEGYLEESPSSPTHIQYFDGEGNSIAVSSSDDNDSSELEIGHDTVANSTGYKFSINNDYNSSDYNKIQIFSPIVNSSNVLNIEEIIGKSLPLAPAIGLPNFKNNTDISNGKEILNSSLQTGITDQI